MMPEHRSCNRNQPRRIFYAKGKQAPRVQSSAAAEEITEEDKKQLLPSLRHGARLQTKTSVWHSYTAEQYHQQAKTRRKTAEAKSGVVRKALIAVAAASTARTNTGDMGREWSQFSNSFQRSEHLSRHIARMIERRVTPAA
jgi:hypothetical protein